VHHYKKLPKLPWRGAWYDAGKSYVVAGLGEGQRLRYVQFCQVSSGLWQQLKAAADFVPWVRMLKNYKRYTCGNETLR
jgi:hypothetical protein